MAAIATEGMAIVCSERHNGGDTGPVKVEEACVRRGDARTIGKAILLEKVAPIASGEDPISAQVAGGYRRRRVQRR